MNETTRTSRKAPLFVGALAAVTLASLGWTWAETSTDAPKPPAAPENCQKCDGPKGKGGPRWEHRGGGPGDRRGGFDRGHGPGGLIRDLDLTAEQKEKVKAVMEAQKPKIKAIRDEERAKMKAVFDEAESQIRPILTKEQQQVLDDAKKLEASKAALKQDDKKPE